MGGVLGSNNLSKEEIEMALNKVKQIVSSNPAVIFSKTYCGYCQRVKQLLTQLGATFKLIELDEESDGDDMHGALQQWTGQRTVPNVFIACKHIGGCDDTLAKNQRGELVKLLTEAGVIVSSINSAQL